MKRLIATISVALTVAATTARADEGMWILTLLDKLNIKTMHDKGCKLSADDIYSINHSSLKDAVIIFGGGCTGEIVSENGLIFTNHHCGYSSIQKLSSVEHNYLRDGFWSRSFSEDLPIDGLKVKFVNRFEDCTTEILKGTEDAKDYEARNEIIEKNTTEIINKNKTDDFHQVIVESFFGGNQYFLIEYTVYQDVRLVATPPESIGKFGHETDNWMWPRHTGDFSIFRVYADKDGKPAEFSTENKPLKPKHYLPISIKGTQIGDYAMTIGFPGSTDRYLTSFGINERMNIDNQSMIGPRGVKQEIWLADMHADEKINIQYASKYARSSNYWKNSIGMNRGLERLNIVEKKQKLEADFQKWANATTERKARYGNILTELEDNYNKASQFVKAQRYIYECQVGGPEIFRFARNAQSLLDALKKEDKQKIESSITYLKIVAEEFYKDYNAPTDQKVVAALGKYYSEIIDKNFWPEYFNTVNKKYKSSFDNYAKTLFAKSIFADKEKLYKFLEKPNAKTLERDLAFVAMKSIYEVWSDVYYSAEPYTLQIENLNRLFIEGLMKMQDGKAFYSDANFTMRLSYGTVGNYSPCDAVSYKHFTTLKGVMEKEDSTNWEFVVPEKLKKLYQTADYGRYADADGTMHVCFTTNNDITGGNSGSPVINGNGELIGLAFDGNWEAMSGDIAFENELQKCINVDIRYVLFIIEKYGEAKNIINELKIVD